MAAITNSADAISAFDKAIDEPPVEALRWALAHWDTASAEFIALLEEYADGSEDPDRPFDALFFIVHLAGDRGDKRAYRPLCRIMLDEERLIGILGDIAAVETLKGVLIKCFDGDTGPLQSVIESPGADSITRGEALLALAWLARDGQTPEPEFRAYLGTLFEEALPKEPDYIWYHLSLVAAVLGYAEFAARTEAMIKSGLIPEEWLTLAELPLLLESGDPVGKAGLEGEEVAPFDDVIRSLEDWPWDEEFEDEEEEPQQPVINPLRHVGRNDPCPCGSGKKFKNCHLVLD